MVSPKVHALTTEEKAYVLSVLRRWLISQGSRLKIDMRALSIRQPWQVNQSILTGQKSHRLICSDGYWPPLEAQRSDPSDRMAWVTNRIEAYCQPKSGKTEK